MRKKSVYHRLGVFFLILLLAGTAAIFLHAELLIYVLMLFLAGILFYCSWALGIGHHNELLSVKLGDFSVKATAIFLLLCGVALLLFTIMAYFTKLPMKFN